MKLRSALSTAYVLSSQRVKKQRQQQQVAARKQNMEKKEKEKEKRRLREQRFNSNVLNCRFFDYEQNSKLSLSCKIANAITWLNNWSWICSIIIPGKCVRCWFYIVSHRFVKVPFCLLLFAVILLGTFFDFRQNGKLLMKTHLAN